MRRWQHVADFDLRSPVNTILGPIVDEAFYQIASFIASAAIHKNLGVLIVEAREGAAGDRFGAPTLMRRRLGQGAFRLEVTDGYQRRCAA